MYIIYNFLHYVIHLILILFNFSLNYTKLNSEYFPLIILLFPFTYSLKLTVLSYIIFFLL